MWLLKKVAYQGKRFPHETERGDDKVALYDRKKPYTFLPWLLMEKNRFLVMDRPGWLKRTTLQLNEIALLANKNN